MDPMQKYINDGKTPEGLRHFSKLLYNNPPSVFGSGYAICVVDSAADEIARLTEENARLAAALEGSKQLTIF